MTAAAIGLAIGVTGCGSGPSRDEQAKKVTLQVLRAYADGDVRTLCHLTPAAKRAQFLAPTTCTSFYRTLFVQQSGQDAIDQAQRPPFRPGPITRVQDKGDVTIVTVAPKRIPLTPQQRQLLVLRYGRDATGLTAPRPFPVTVFREDGHLVAGF